MASKRNVVAAPDKYWWRPPNGVRGDEHQGIRYRVDNLRGSRFVETGFRHRSTRTGDEMTWPSSYDRQAAEGISRPAATFGELAHPVHAGDAPSDLGRSDQAGTYRFTEMFRARSRVFATS
jgi:hypothetical protein